MLTPIDYYRDPEVQERIAEYCGGSALEPELCTAEYLVGYGTALEGIDAIEPYISQPKTGFHKILENGLDIFRSLWDQANIIGVLDVEYFNLDFPGEVYLDQVGVFQKVEPLYQAIRELYQAYEIQPLTLMTGQGYHFSFQVQSGTKADLTLEKLGQLSDSLEGKYRATASKRHRPVSLRYARSFDGMGRVMEFFAHRIIRAFSSSTELPLVITDVAVGQGKKGREAISLDLSCFGDPVYMRDIRCAFSTHQKHKVQTYKVGEAISRATPVQVAVPRDDHALQETLELRRNFRKSAEYAADTYCFIPNFSVNFKRVIDDYRQSDLFRFHRWFDSEKQDHWTVWDKTYRALDLRSLPPCVRQPLTTPNDLLLKPTNLQTLTRFFLARGWHPQHIVGLVRSRWEGPHGWPPDQWKHFDAGSRAAFYVRVFAGLIADGLDELVDHNCISHQEKGYCPQPDCGYNLADFRWDGKF
jgi:hypothetical protein